MVDITKPPANVEAEAALISAVLDDPKSVYQLADLVEPESFFYQPHGWIWNAQLALGEAADAVTVNHYLNKSNVGGDAKIHDYIKGLAATLPAYNNPRHYAQVVYEFAVRRRLVDASAKIAQLAYDQVLDLDTVMQRARDALIKAETTSSLSGNGSLMLGADEFDADLIARQNGKSAATLSTGVKRLDNLMGGGIERSEYFVMGGAPGTGKTAVALQMAYINAMAGKVVNYHSFEVSRDSLRRRLISMRTAEYGFRFREGRNPGVPFGMMKRGGLKQNELDICLQAHQEIKKIPLRIFEGGDGRTPAAIKSKAMQSRNLSGGLDLIITDQLQHMNGGSDRMSDKERVSAVSRGMLDLTTDKDLGGVAVVGLSRLSRAGYEVPKISDLKESGDIESDAHVIALLQKEDAGLKIYISKNRDWGLFQESLTYHSEVNRIS